MKKIILWIYEIFIFLPILVIATIITAIVVIIGVSIGNKQFWSSRPPRYWSKLICRVALCNISVKGQENFDPEKSYIFAPNHQSVFDVFLLYGYLGADIKFVQKHTLRKIPFVGYASEKAGHVFINQTSYKSMKSSLIEVEKRLAKGASIAMFPEGARTFTGKMDKFRRGPFIVAKEMNMPIVPVTINGAYEVMKIHTYLINPGKLELVIHKPINPSTYSEEELPQLMHTCEEEVKNGLWERYK